MKLAYEEKQKALRAKARCVRRRLSGAQRSESPAPPQPSPPAEDPPVPMTVERLEHAMDLATEPAEAREPEAPKPKKKKQKTLFSFF